MQGHVDDASRAAPLLHDEILPINPTSTLQPVFLPLSLLHRCRLHRVSKMCVIFHRISLES